MHPRLTPGDAKYEHINPFRRSLNYRAFAEESPISGGLDCFDYSRLQLLATGICACARIAFTLARTIQDRQRKRVLYTRSYNLVVLFLRVENCSMLFGFVSYHWRTTCDFDIVQITQQREPKLAAP